MYRIMISLGMSLALLSVGQAKIGAPPSAKQSRMVEWTFASQKTYSDPFNNVDVDVIFNKGGLSWRVPAFWRGGQKWTVRFAPPSPGEYAYRLESTDRGNPDLNGHEGKVTITAYRGPSELLRHGMLRVSVNKRYFEYADGTPFFWLGDTWWMGLSDRLSWEGFKELTADRKTKGFTAIQLVAGLVPDEVPPSDPGNCNEGGCVWTPKFERINPGYFDAADRRIEYLLDSGLTPVIFGAWGDMLKQIGAEKLKQHWRYIVARYGAYPVIWVLSGETKDPPEAIAQHYPAFWRKEIVRGWSEIARYVREIDPYHHPLSAHEIPPPVNFPLQDDALTDFALFQTGHALWAIAAQIAQTNLQYSLTTSVKPLVQGEIAYEAHYTNFYENDQRAAFWLAMLNGAAGFTYGAVGVFEAVSPEKPLYRLQYSFHTWKEGMKLPGSYQLGLAAKLLRQYPWWQFTPHPEWVTPRGTTLLKPREKLTGQEFGPLYNEDGTDAPFPTGEWQAAGGDWHLPYAAGVPGRVRIIYIPYTSYSAPVPTVLGLEPGVRYDAYFWDPSTGIKFSMGAVQRPQPGKQLFEDRFGKDAAAAWSEMGPGSSTRGEGGFCLQGERSAVVNGIAAEDLVAAATISGNAHAGLLLRYQDQSNYVAAVYSPKTREIYLVERVNGKTSAPFGAASVPDPVSELRFTAELRGDKGAMSIGDGQHRVTSPIVDLHVKGAGRAGAFHQEDAETQCLKGFELRQSPILVKDATLDRTLRDAEGRYRGMLQDPGPVGAITEEIPGIAAGWSRFGRDKHILLDAYRPERLPTFTDDWVLILEAPGASAPLAHAASADGVGD